MVITAQYDEDDSGKLELDEFTSVIKALRRLARKQARLEYLARTQGTKREQLVARGKQFLKKAISKFFHLKREFGKANAKIKVILSLFQVLGSFGENFSIPCAPPSKLAETAR